MANAIKTPKTYIIKVRISGARTNTDRTSYVRGTIEALIKYYSLKEYAYTIKVDTSKIKTGASFVKALEKKYDYQYGCTYTTASVDLVTEVPADTSCSEATI